MWRRTRQVRRQPARTTLLTPARLCDGSVPVANCTEVKMVPVGVAPANQFADTPSGIPDPATAGPPWIQIGTEGGFMPAPVVVPQQPIGYNLDPAYFNFGIVNQHSLFLMPAERADVIVDFSAFAGNTLILYNDAPAPVPAGDTHYDYFTGDGNGMDGGGAPNTQPGYGPNTRTIMQIQVGSDRRDADHGRHAREPPGRVRQERRKARRLRGVAGSHHRSAGGVQLRLQQHVPGGRVAVRPQYRGHAEDLPADRPERRAPARASPSPSR